MRERCLLVAFMVASSRLRPESFDDYVGLFHNESNFLPRAPALSVKRT